MSRALRFDALNVHVARDVEQMAREAASEAASVLRAATSARGEANVMLATGNSQLAFLAALVEVPDVAWECVRAFHMDEYVGLPPSHRASFQRYMRERVASLVNPKVFHYLAGDAWLPIKECERYAQLLRAQPIDLCCLGIGENGHLAFNDPLVADFNDNRSVKIVRLDEACKRQQVGEGYFPNLESVPSHALTLTIPALCAAKRMICVVPEKRKAEAVRAALRGPICTDCPASILRRQAQCFLFLDAESASLI